ncbi:MAG: type IV toxin-antitoxin system AbiEi family antitoxin domain-containing protein [Dehalococcoidia bacterium]|jgi:predicted transcriptional regulator of viral defense system|nr:type IV toxin-antitoxin system AbiEi family antitoxin domain-containing protein [Dehalococcoidia bacterium]
MSHEDQVSPPVRVSEFLAQRAVFTVAELDGFLSARGSSSRNTRKSLLTYYQARGRVLRLRRGLYAVVPIGSRPDAGAVDPYLVAAKMAEDAVLAYHTALEFHGRAYSVYSRITYASTMRSVPLRLGSKEIRSVPVPPALRAKGRQMFGVTSLQRSGAELRVTDFERTFVDVLDRPDLVGSWEEIWRSLELVEFFDLDRVAEYVHLLGNATTAAKVGFFLEQHRDTLMVDEAHLEALRRLRPRQPHYLSRRGRGRSRLVKDWNLIVPEQILERSWEERL